MALGLLASQQGLPGQLLVRLIDRVFISEKISDCGWGGAYPVPGPSPHSLTQHFCLFPPAGSPPGWASPHPSVLRLIGRFLGSLSSRAPEFPATSLRLLFPATWKRKEGVRLPPPPVLVVRTGMGVGVKQGPKAGGISWALEGFLAHACWGELPLPCLT